MTPPGVPKAASRYELLRMLASRIYFSKAYISFYLFMVVLNVVSIIVILSSYGIYSYKVSPGLIALELLINVLLALEITVRFLAQQDSFWSSWWNTMDVLITILCILSVFALVLLPAEDEMEEIFATAIVGLRYIVQGLRIMLLLRAGRASQRRTNFHAAEIEFSTIQQHGFDEENISDKVDVLEDGKRVGGSSVSRNRSSSQIGLMNIVGNRDISDSMGSYQDDEEELPLGTFDLARLKNAISDSMDSERDELEVEKSEVDNVSDFKS